MTSKLPPLSLVIELFRYNDHLPIDQICEELKISERTARDYIGKLRKIGLMHGRKINNKYTYYISYGGFDQYLRRLKDPIREITRK